MGNLYPEHETCDTPIVRYTPSNVQEDAPQAVSLNSSFFRDNAARFLMFVVFLMPVVNFFLLRMTLKAIFNGKFEVVAAGMANTPYMVAGGQCNFVAEDLLQTAQQYKVKLKLKMELPLKKTAHYCPCCNTQKISII